MNISSCSCYEYRPPGSVTVWTAIILLHKTINIVVYTYLYPTPQLRLSMNAFRKLWRCIQVQYHSSITRCILSPRPNCFGYYTLPTQPYVALTPTATHPMYNMIFTPGSGMRLSRQKQEVCVFVAPKMCQTCFWLSWHCLVATKKPYGTVSLDFSWKYTCSESLCMSTIFYIFRESGRPYAGIWAAQRAIIGIEVGQLSSSLGTCVLANSGCVAVLLLQGFLWCYPYNVLWC